MNKDLTRGPIFKTLLFFSLPILGSMIFQQAYTLADSVIAGKAIGEQALAAVNASNEITSLYLAFAVGCNIGCSVVVSQLFGAGRTGELKTAVYTMFFSACGLALLLTGGGLLLSPSLLRAIRTPDAFYTDAVRYLNIYLLGLLFLFLYNISTGIFTALGDSKTPLYFLICSTLLNIGLDILFMVRFKMGVAGAGWATLIAQGLACLLSCLTLLKRIRAMYSPERPALFSGVLLKKMFLIAVPSTLQQGCVSIGNMMVQSVINRYSAATVAGIAAGFKLNSFGILLLCAMTNVFASFTAQNIGAGKPERVAASRKIGFLMIGAAALPIVLIFVFAGEPLIRLIIQNPSPEVLSRGAEFLRIVPPFFLMIMFKLIDDGLLRGSGGAKYCMMDTGADLIVRVSCTYLLTPLLGVAGVAWSWVLGWVAGLIVCEFFIARGVWKKTRLIG